MQIMSSRFSKQKGVALISVLLVFAIVAAIAAEVARLHFLDLRRTANSFNSKQAYYYALAGEEYVRQILARDYRDGDREQTDSFLDNWHELRDSFELDEGQLEISIEDMQGRFNLNSLLAQGGSINSDAARVFDQLLSEQALSRDISAQVQDWLDSDDNLRSGGAESVDYQSLTSPYLAANSTMADASELYLLSAIEPESYHKLAGLVSALPADTAINLNTLKPDVLAALAPQITETQRKQFDKKQQAGGYTKASDWLADPIGQYLAPSGLDFAVKSHYFQARITASFAGRVSQLQTLFYRNPGNGEIRILNRQNRFE